MSEKIHSIAVDKLPKHFEYQRLEKAWDEKWQESKIYEFDPKFSRENNFAIDTPPPTVSGSLHIGHIFSYSHADFIARQRRMSGKNVFYPMGWDDNGLPTERRVQNLYHVRCEPGQAYEENLKLEPASAKKKKDRPLVISRTNFIELCEEVTKMDEEAFMNLFKHIGLSVDWNQEYATINKKCRRLAQWSFLDLFQKGYAYSLESPTMWDVDFQTAVAQAELEDREIPGAFHEIEFSVEDSDKKFVIATTRPELLPACIGVTAHPDDKRYKDLFGKKAVTPLFSAPVPIFPSELADPEKGTGILMVCSFGDATDVHWWREQKLELRQIITRVGRIREFQFGTENFESKEPEKANQFLSDLIGKNVKQAKAKIVELLRAEGFLKKEPEAIQHSVKFYEKGDRPLEFVSTRQWFVKLLDKKDKLIEQGEKIKWHPEYMKQRFTSWTENLNQDWCISRQRYFGVPIPVWYPLNKNAEPDFSNPILASEDQLPIDPTTETPKGFSEDQRGQSGGFVGEEDVFDTWFTSSLSPQIGSGGHFSPELHNQLFPMDLRPQGHEIIRTWAFYTIAKSLMHENKLPWTNIALSGWVVDPNKKKMSKSKGNTVTPEKLIEEYSADAVRYWSAGARLGTDTAFDEGVFKIGRRLVTKLYNASKFVLSLDADKSEIIDPVDLSFQKKLYELVLRCEKLYEDFNFATALQETERFFWSEFTDSYLELVKQRARSEDPGLRGSAVASLRKALNCLLRLFAPILPYVTEEIWSWEFGKGSSIHRSSWPKLDEFSSLELPKTAEGSELLNLMFSEVNKAKTEQGLSVFSPKVRPEGKVEAKIKPGQELQKEFLRDLLSATHISEELFEQKIDESVESVRVSGRFKKVE